MMRALPINENKKFKYSIYFQSFDEESLEAGSSLESGYEKIESVDTIGDILYLANSVYGIYMPVSFGNWESTEPLSDKDYYEKGISKYFSIHISNEDGIDISDEENEFITFLLSDGKYNSSAFEQYAVGGIVLSAIAVGVGALITYFYFKGKKGGKGKKELVSISSKSVTYKIKGKDRKFPIKDAWRKEHNLENKAEKYEVPQGSRKSKFEMGGDASEYYHEVEYGEGGIAKAKEIIMTKIGWNEEVADYFVSKSEKFAVWLADSILKDELKSRRINKEQYLQLNPKRLNIINNNYGDGIREILDWLQHPVTPKQDLRNLSFDEAYEKAREWHNELQVLGGDIDFAEPVKNRILKIYPKNSDEIEYYWVFIPSNYCDLESSRMGHCGRTGYGNKLISLRSIKPYGKGHTLSDSHVTIAYNENDGIFYQVKGKKNQKPAEKYFSYIFDLVKSMLTDEELKRKFNEDETFTGFGSEYGQEEDYGYEDMTKEEIRELYEIKPTLFENAEDNYMLFNAGVITLDEFKEIVEREPDTFKSFGNQIKLYDLGIVSQRPSTIIEVSKDCGDVGDLLNIGRDFSDDLVSQILCGDIDELSDSWSYYYENPKYLVDNLNKENEQLFIDEIVRITGLDETIVKENGIEHYLGGEDEEFDSEYFDNLIRVLASAQNNADNNDYLNYLYEAIKSALEELGTVNTLNDEGVKMTIDLSNSLSDEEIFDIMDNYEFTDIDDLFYEVLDIQIERPRLSIDDRYSPNGSEEDFNDYVSGTDLEQGYERGGNIHAKYISTKNKTKTMKSIKTEFANGGNLGVSKKEYFDVVSNWVYFTFNYPMGFVQSAFNSTHLEEKFSSSYTRYGSIGVCISFWGNLDLENRRILSLWIKNNYVNDKGSNIQSISDDDYADIITHWNLFCFNYPQGFVEKAFVNDNLLVEHFGQKFTRAYESAGSIGAVNKFFTELSRNNQEILTEWVYDNYKEMKFADGGSVKSLSSIYKKYIENEDENLHSENVLLLAKNFGSKEDIIESKRILALHEKEGSLSTENGQKRMDLHLKLIDKARVEMNKEGIEFKEGGSVKSKSRRKKRQPKVARTQFEEETYEFSHGGTAQSRAEELLKKLKTEKILKRYIDTRGTGTKYFETIIPNKEEKGYYKRYESTSRNNLGILQNAMLDETDLLGLFKPLPTIERNKMEKGGGVNDISYDSILKVLKDKIEDAIEEVPIKYENSSDFKGEEVEHESRDGFIAYTDGGYEAVWFEQIGGLYGSGYGLPTKQLDTEMNRQIDYNLSLAKEMFVEKYPDLVEEIGEENIDYNSLNEAGYSDEAEELSENESESLFDEGSIMMQITAYYYSPENDRGIEKTHTIRLFGDVNLESPYHRQGNLDDSYDIDITFNSISELEEKMDAGIVEIISWFDGNMYNDSTTEMKIRRMEEGGEVGDLVEVELTNGKIIKGKIEKTNPFKIRTDSTSIQVIPNPLIKSVTKINEFAEGGDIDATIKNWYRKNYPTDDLGEELNDFNTFEDLYNGISNRVDVYEIIGVGDSVIRERLFDHLSNIKGVKYENIYQKWLDADGLLTNAEIDSMYADGGEVQDWMEEGLAYLIEETGFTDLEITIVSDNGNEFIANDNNVEYRVFKTEDDAQVEAEERVLDDLKENPEYFNRNWLMNYIDGRGFETVLFEINYQYVLDIKLDTGGNYENDLIEQLVLNGLMDEDDARSSEAEELAEERIEDLANLLTENQLDEGNDGLDYIIDNFGEEEAFRMIVENNSIDMDSATKNAVYVDGIAHFLSSYDGETLYLPNEYVAYRVN